MSPRWASDANPYGPIGMGDGPPARYVDADTPPRCQCSHARDHHITDRSGRPMCRSAACGCSTYRPKETS